jgi:hypothetical protein
MRLVLLALFVAAALLAPRGAAAGNCTELIGGFSPLTETPMPPRGSVYLFAPFRVQTSTWITVSPARLARAYANGTSEDLRTELREEDLASLLPGISIEGASISMHVIAQQSYYTVVRIDYEALGPRFTLRWSRRRHFRDLVVSYPVQATAQAPYSRVTAVERPSLQSVCPAEDIFTIALDSNALAYRLTWSDRTVEVVPPKRGIFYRSRPVTPEHLLELGMPRCLATRADREPFDSLRTFRLTALYADGSEREFPVARARLDPYHPVLPTKLVGAVAELLVEHDEAPPAPLRGQARAFFLVFVVGLLLGGGAAVAVLHRRVLHRRAHQPRC